MGKVAANAAYKRNTGANEPDGMGNPGVSEGDIPLSVGLPDADERARSTAPGGVVYQVE
jgi:hypothetical protein